MNVIVLVTSALTPVRYEERRAEYERSLSILRSFGYEPLIVECVLPAGPSFLESYGEVFYANVNDSSLRNKGVNEGKAIVKALEYFRPADADMVVKLTGRYHFSDRSFLNIVAGTEADCVVKYDFQGQVFSGCYAMIARHMRRMYSSFEYRRMEREMINIETMMAKYVSSRRLAVLVVPRLGVVARIFGDGQPVLTEW